MEQYSDIKKNHPDEILMFRLGDFYEMFYEDAKTAARTLGITLTSRFKGDKAVPMAGVPHHSVENYIKRLLKSGHKVAICDQMEDPEEADGLVERAVVRVITPGTLTEESILSEKINNFLSAIIVDGKNAGVSWIDLSTGKFLMQDLHVKELPDELTRINPSECIVPESFQQEQTGLINMLKSSAGVTLTFVPDWTYDKTNAYKSLTGHFQTANLSGFGCENLLYGTSCAGAVMEYLKETQRTELKHITRVEPFQKEDTVYLDRPTQLSLELTRTMRSESEEGTLLHILDKTCTPMGARLLREWLTAPLKNAAKIQARLEAVQELFADHITRKELRVKLKEIFDLERISAKLGSNRANPRDLIFLKQTLHKIPAIKNTIAKFQSEAIKFISGSLEPLPDAVKFLSSSIKDDAPVQIKEGGIIKAGFNEELDKLLGMGKEGKNWIAKFQADEIKRTGIGSLKIGYTQVFGYYIEITNAHQERIPQDYIRKQTLKNAERYITPQLKDYETMVLNAEEKSRKLEYELFLQIRDETVRHISAFQKNAFAIAVLDVFCSLSETAFENKYCRPEVNDSGTLSIIDGRHPVIEKFIENKFVPNDTALDNNNNRMMIITGPNMAGKSTYIRQVALITLMAQTGSFVPAKQASIGIVDRIFTRVGASDELTKGSSTFMVEMNETANILNNATNRSLIVLDEIGRGTSTFDGVSIAWAVAEFINDRLGARTLFATHYHELTELELVLPGVKNFHISVKEWGDKIIFVHKIKQGGTDKSYGVYVARLAGIPVSVVERARQILTELEALTLDESNKPKFAKTLNPLNKPLQMHLFNPAHPAIDVLKDIDVDNLTPVQALQKLQQLKEMAKKN